MSVFLFLLLRFLLLCLHFSHLRLCNCLLTRITQYSFTGLSEHHSFRTISVSEVEAQLRKACTLQHWAVKSKSGRCYPHHFYNFENLDVTITVCPPWNEYPILENSSFTDGDHPGYIRVIFAKTEDNKIQYDVIYHNPEKKRAGNGSGTGVMYMPFEKAERREWKEGERRFCIVTSEVILSEC